MKKKIILFSAVASVFMASAFITISVDKATQKNDLYKQNMEALTIGEVSECDLAVYQRYRREEIPTFIKDVVAAYTGSLSISLPNGQSVSVSLKKGQMATVTVRYPTCESDNYNCCAKDHLYRPMEVSTMIAPD